MNSGSTGGSSGRGDDAVIGLNVGGRLFYTNRSTLTNGSPYFAARFGGSFDAGPSRTDENGWKVFFVDADPGVFEHILNYLRDGIENWPSEAENPILRNRIRALAEYYGIDSMASALTPPKKFEPTESGKGVLYWLGTKKGTAEYQNPLDVGAVSFSGSSPIFPERKHRMFSEFRPLCGESDDFFDRDFESFRYHELDNDLWCVCACSIMWCGGGSSRKDLIIKFEDVQIKPKHYSLRFSECHGMADWNFQASNDGESWVTLHRARNEKSILRPSQEKIESMQDALYGRWRDSSASQRRLFATSLVETDLRGLWELSSSEFFQYFRFVGSPSRDRNDPSKIFCMHAVGFEVYGDVKNLSS